MYTVITNSPTNKSWHTMLYYFFPFNQHHSYRSELYTLTKAQKKSRQMDVYILQLPHLGLCVWVAALVFLSWLSCNHSAEWPVSRLTIQTFILIIVKWFIWEMVNCSSPEDFCLGSLQCLLMHHFDTYAFQKDFLRRTKAEASANLNTVKGWQRFKPL